jgi:hypothetical protein
MTVITPYAQYLGSVAGAGGDLEYTLRWPYRNSNAPVQDVKSDNTTNGYYFWRKFVYEGSSEGVNRASTSINQPIIRYADILLRWAECLNEAGGVTQTALDLVNQVRTRAGQPSLQNSNSSLPTYVASQSDFRQRIYNERRVEFPNEGVNYFDELRWGTWKTSVFAPTTTYPVRGSLEMWGTAIVPYTYQGDYVTTWPIPTSVVTISNGAVAATPGWTY